MIKQVHFFVLLAFLVGIIAPACGFVWGGKYSTVEICTTEGIESRVVQSEEQPSPSHYEEQCQFCFTQANPKTFLPDLQAFEALRYAIEKAGFHYYKITLSSRQTRDHAARAPPILV